MFQSKTFNEMSALAIFWRYHARHVTGSAPHSELVPAALLGVRCSSQLEIGVGPTWIYQSTESFTRVQHPWPTHTHTRAHTHTRTHTSIWHWKLRDLWYFLNLNQRYWSRSLVAVKKRQTEHHRLYCWRMVHRDHLDQPVDSDLRRGLAILQVSVGSARLYIEIPSKY